MTGADVADGMTQPRQPSVAAGGPPAASRFLRPVMRGVADAVGSRLAAVLSGVALVGGGAMSVVWLVYEIPQKGALWFEPLVESSSIIGGALSVLAARQRTAREDKRRILRDLATECVRNADILTDRSFDVALGAQVGPVVYDRRLLVSAISTAFDSGSVARLRDDALATLLHGWRDVAESFNHRLDIVEMRVLIGGTDVGLAYHRRLSSPGGYIDLLWDELRTIVDHLVRYPDAAEVLTRLPDDRRVWSQDHA